MTSFPHTTRNPVNEGTAGAPPAVSRCPHCGTPVEGAAAAYCCAGCEMAAAIIQGAGLAAYYDEREEYAPRPGPAPGGWETVPIEVDEAGVARITLMVDGLRCASCVWVTEHLLQATEGVQDAMVSYATGRTALTWRPDTVELAALAGRISALGYRPRILGASTGPDRDLLVRLGVATFAALNIMLIAVGVYAGWFSSMEARYSALFRWATLVLATPVALWCAQPFFAGAWQGIRHRVLHMDLPIAIAIAVLYTQGFIGTLAGRDTYLDSMAMLVALLLAGRVLESGGRRRTAEAALSLAAAVPSTARRVTAGGVETVPADGLAPGDRVEIGAGEEFAADGAVDRGAGTVAMAIVTGESAPARLSPGSRVVAGTVLIDGALTYVVERAGKDTTVHRMADELRESADRPARLSSADRIAPWFTAGTLAVAALTFWGWYIAAGLEPALEAAVAVLVVACPCALALSRPLAAAAGLGAAARRGLLFRSADPLLDLTQVDTVALDKTGTVTGGDLVVTEAARDVLRLAAGVERSSVHPVARAIVAEAVRRGIPLPEATGVVETPGVGIAGTIDGHLLRIRSADEPGVVRIESGTEWLGDIRFGDHVRVDSGTAVGDLETLGLEVALLTGDHEAAARGIAQATGIGVAEAGMLPAAKAAWIAARQGEGHHVLFAGDGLNDGPALATADVGIAMGTGAASSVLAADGLVVGGSLRSLEAGFRAAFATRRTIRRNQIRSIVYNIAAVGAAAAGLINPLIAALLMPASSALVIWSASRVERAVRSSEA